MKYISFYKQLQNYLKAKQIGLPPFLPSLALKCRIDVQMCPSNLHEYFPFRLLKVGKIQQVWQVEQCPNFGASQNSFEVAVRQQMHRECKVGGLVGKVYLVKNLTRENKGYYKVNFTKRIRREV